MLGVLPGVVGSLQAMEAIKLILDIGKPAIGKLVHYDALATSMRSFTLNPDPQCARCGDKPTIEGIQETKFKSTNKQGNQMKEITVQELKNKMDQGTLGFLLDVRMPKEYESANLGGVLVPLPELMESLDKIPKDEPIIIYCKAGGRSARACLELMQVGYADVTNVLGGTDGWRNEIDPDLPPA